MRDHIYLYILAVTLLLSSCATQRDGQIYQGVEPSQIQAGMVGDDDFELEVSYVGAIGHSFVYECYIKNHGDVPIVVDKSNFYMEYGDGKVLFPSEGSTIAEQLRQEKSSLKKQKKANTATSILAVGLTTLVGVSSGVSVGESLLFSAEPIVYLLDDRRWYNEGIESVEDEIKYVQEAQFDHQIVLPGHDIIRDLLFSTTKITSDVTINYTHEGEAYSVTFPKKVFR